MYIYMCIYIYYIYILYIYIYIIYIYTFKLTGWMLPINPNRNVSSTSEERYTRFIDVLSSN